MNSPPLLDALAQAGLSKLAGEATDLKVGELTDLNQYVYFPSSGLMALRCSGGRFSVQVALVGAHSSTGAFFSRRLVGSVLVPGVARRFMRDYLHQLAFAYRGLHCLLMADTEKLIEQSIAHVSAASEGTLPQRLAAWFLLASRQAEIATIHITHDKLALLLGARRASVTIAMQKLGRHQALHFRRNEVSIQDLKLLERLAQPQVPSETVSASRPAAYSPQSDGSSPSS